MANQKHSAFNISGNPFIRGAALVAAIDLNSPPSTTGGVSANMVAHNLTPLSLDVGDILIARSVGTWKDASGENFSIRHRFVSSDAINYDGLIASESYTGNGWIRFSIETRFQIVVNSAFPTRLGFLVEDTQWLEDLAGTRQNFSQTYQYLNPNETFDTLYTLGFASGSSELIVESNYVQLFGGEA